MFLLSALLACGVQRPLDTGCDGTPWYADVDEDGYGDPNVTELGCAAPPGFVEAAGDCDDTDPSVHAGAVEVCDGKDQDCDALADDGLDRAWYPDGDRDGFGDATVAIRDCAAPDGFVSEGGDCDDADPSVHPGAAELCDGVDQDCDGQIDDGLPGTSWHPDLDEDGAGSPDVTVLACAAPAGHVANPDDCDDADPTRAPTANEICDGVDNDCDGALDEDAIDAATWFEDRDGDGAGDPSTAVVDCDPGTGRVLNGDDCDDADDLVFPGAPELCDGADQDCDAQIDEDAVDAVTWYRDADGDGVGDAMDTMAGCGDPPLGWVAVAGDCDDTAPAVSNGGVEVPGDGLDSDCDGLELCFVDGDGDGVGRDETLPSGDWTCTSLARSARGDDCDDLDPLVAPTLAETPYDGRDNDCEPSTPDDDVDADGYPAADDCDDTDPGVNPDFEPAVVFTDVTADAGLDLVQWDAVRDPAVCMAEPMAGGAAAGDFDGDGFVDLFVPRLYANDLLFHNQGDGTFAEVAVASGIDHVGSSNAAMWFDADGDGDLDLYVASMGLEGNRLYLNDGAGSFVEDAAGRAADLPLLPGECAFHWGVSAGDPDLDGDLDVHVSTWQPDGIVGSDRSRLLVNEGRGHFLDGTAAAGLDLSLRAPFTPAFADVDDDGFVDLAIAADWNGSGLWINQGDGTFLETTAAAGVGTDENGMGADLADVDDDGDLDWFVTAIYDDTVPCPTGWGCSGNRLYLNNGDGTFTDGTDAAGVRDGAWGWGAAFFDVDNDGDLDLGHTNGFPMGGFEHDEIRVFENDGRGRFRDVACQLGVALPGQGRAFVPLDIDNDGDLDLFTTLNGASPRLYRNDGGDANSWLRVQLRDPGSGNPFAIGAQVRLQATTLGVTRRRDVHANSSFTANRSPEVHFGLGDHETAVFRLEITWPDGAVQTESSVMPRQILVISRTVP